MFMNQDPPSINIFIIDRHKILILQKAPSQDHHVSFEIYPIKTI